MKGWINRRKISADTNHWRKYRVRILSHYIVLVNISWILFPNKMLILGCKFCSNCSTFFFFLSSFELLFLWFYFYLHDWLTNYITLGFFRVCSIHQLIRLHIHILLYNFMFIVKIFQLYTSISSLPSLVLLSCILIHITYFVML